MVGISLKIPDLNIVKNTLKSFKVLSVNSAQHTHVCQPGWCVIQSIKEKQRDEGGRQWNKAATQLSQDREKSAVKD